MSELSEYALRFQSRLAALSDRTTNRVLRLWRDVSVMNLDDGWDAIAPQVEQVVSTAQVTAAGMAQPYVARSLSLQGVSAPAVSVVPGAFAGVTRTGQAVVPELFTAVTTTKDLIKAGAGVGRAFHAGSVVLSVIVANIIRDTGRGAVSAAAGGRGVSRTVRVVQPGACSRCAILAGATGLKPFQRHPRCRCTNMPLPPTGGVPEGFFESPSDYFESLTEAEQDRIFTKAGAETIRLGGDPIQVVNARRGAIKASTTGARSVSRLERVRIGTAPDGSPVMGYATLEGTTARGVYGRGRGDLARTGSDRYRRTRTTRLMPETILSLTDDVELRKVLLRDAGYIKTPVTNLSSNAWIEAQAAQRASDNEIASAFYRSLGIR